MTNAIAALIVASISSNAVVRPGIDCSTTFSEYALEIPTNAVTVTVLTNVVQGSNERRACSVCDGCLDGGILLHEHDTRGRLYPATERTETTVVTERRTLRFKWLDVWREIVSEKELSRTVKRWKLKEQWEEQP